MNTLEGNPVQLGKEVGGQRTKGWKSEVGMIRMNRMIPAGWDGKGKRRHFKPKLFREDKGQKMMIRAFIDTIRQGGLSPITFEDIYAASLTSFKVLESLIRWETVTVWERMICSRKSCY